MTLADLEKDPTHVDPPWQWMPRAVRQPAFLVGVPLTLLAVATVVCLGWDELPLEAAFWGPVLVLAGIARARNTASIRPAFWSFWAGG